jgi:hypothetical protein
MIRALLALLLAATTLGAAELEFAPNGDALVANELLRLRVSGRPGNDYGILSWVFQPTGHEMVDVLYGQTDYVKGHLLGERWDPVTQVGLPTTGNPDLGRLFVPLAHGVLPQIGDLILTQQARGAYTWTRTLIVRRDLATVEVRYHLRNESAPRQALGLRFFSSASPGARGPYQRKDDDIFVPLADQVVALDQALNNERFHQAYGADIFFQPDWAGQPRRGWLRADRLNATLAGNWAVQRNREHGDGLFFQLDAAALQGYYTSVGATLEPCLDPVVLAPGEEWSFTAYVGAFTGGKGRQIVGATPLYVVTQPLVVQNGRLRGELIPTFQGTLRVVVDGKAAAELPATAAAPLTLDVPAGAAWQLTALDRAGQELGTVTGEQTTLRPVQLDYRAPKRPGLGLGSVLDEDGKALRQQDLRRYTVVCPWSGSDAEKAAARAIAQRLGIGLAYESVAGPQLVVGNAAAQYVADIGQLRYSVTADWPGAGKGVIAYFANLELTAAPVILIAGSDAAGTLKAAERFTREYLADQPAAPTGFTLWPSRPDRKLYPFSRPDPTLDGRGNLPAEAPIVLQAARGEYEPAQVALTAFDELRDVKVTATPLTHATTGAVLDTKRSLTPQRRRLDTVGIRWVEYFPLDRKDGWAGYPDPLLEQPERTIPAGESRPLWLTVFVPETAPAGTYRSTLTATNGSFTATIPLEVQVWDFNLPLAGRRALHGAGPLPQHPQPAGHRARHPAADRQFRGARHARHPPGAGAQCALALQPRGRLQGQGNALAAGQRGRLPGHGRLPPAGHRHLVRQGGRAVQAGVPGLCQDRGGPVLRVQEGVSEALRGAPAAGGQRADPELLRGGDAGPLQALAGPAGLGRPLRLQGGG